jgi:hypothetical protein
VLDKPSDQTIDDQAFKPDYPGFTGLDSALGASFEIRLLGYFGVELDLMHAHEAGAADITVNDLATNQVSSFEVEIGHDALHVPLLFKGCLPGKVVTPLIFIGPEFVIPSDRADAQELGVNATTTTHTAHTEDYTMFAYGIGFEFNLPSPTVDLRIPLTIRGGYNPSVSDVREERARHTPASGPPFSEISYSTAWKHTARAQLGMTINF